MWVAGFTRSRAGDRVVLAATLRSRLGERHLTIDVPADLAVAESESSYAVPPAVMPALIAGEDLHIDATVSPRVLHGASAAAAIYEAWDPTLSPLAITATDTVPPPAVGSGVGVFFSRGVDSMYEAALADRDPAALTHAVFIDGIEPRHSAAVRAEEIALAEEAGRLLALEPVVVRTNVRDLTNDRRDWADVNAAALAGIGLALGAGLRRIVIPSSNSIDSLVPYGSHPALDPLFSTEATDVEYGDVRAGRLGKVVAIARDRADLLPYLKVCFDEDRPDNCGRCGKCLITMCCLRAVDALDLATGFPASIDLEAIRHLRPAPLHSRLHWLEVARGLGSHGPAGDLRAAILEALARSARPTVARRARLGLDRLLGRRGSRHPMWREPTRGFDARFNNDVLAMVTTGRPERPLARSAELPQPPALVPATTVRADRLRRRGPEAATWT